MTSTSSAREPGRWAIALAGAVALAVAMGIGRFAFTPLLPLMQERFGLTISQGGMLAGVASALVFVYTSGWCLTQLARRNAAALGGAMYTGPGAGIVLSGLFASGMVQWGWRAQTGWAIFGVLAIVLVAAVWRIFRGAPARCCRRA